MRILLTGASGQLGAYLLREAETLGLPVVAWSGQTGGSLFGAQLRPVPLTDAGAVSTAFQEARPDVVLHAAALATVAICHQHPQLAWQINRDATQLLTELADLAGCRFVLVSTDMVFDGTQAPYREDAAPAPISLYGQTKAAGERCVRAAGHGLVVRVSLLFGPGLTPRRSFFDEQMDALRSGRPLRLFEDEWRTPLGLDTAARALLALAQSHQTGVLHLGGPERLSRLEMGYRLAAHVGLSTASIQPCRRGDVPAPEPRPCDLSLDSSRWRLEFPEMAWPGWEASLKEMFSAAENR